MQRKMCKNTGIMYWKTSYKTNGIRKILLFDAGWKEPKGYMKKNKKTKTILYEGSHTVWKKENERIIAAGLLLGPGRTPEKK